MVKLDYLRCELLSIKFKDTVAVDQSELTSTTAQKETATDLIARRCAHHHHHPHHHHHKDGEGAAPVHKEFDPVEKLALVAAERAAAPLLTKVDEKRTAALSLKQRIEALKVLERALQACQRMGPDSDSSNDDGDEDSAADKLDGGVVPLLTEGCVLAWNLAQPLLQPHLRSHVHRILSTCVDALEDAGSPLQDLRAKLHFEVARCEMATDFLAKAAEHLDKAKLCDYGYIDTDEAKPTPQAEERVDELVLALRQEHDAEVGDEVSKPKIMATLAPEELNVAAGGKRGPSDEAIATDDNERRRPLDALVLPAVHKLDLKKSIYIEPDSAEDRAMLLLEQAREVTSVSLQRTLLQQVTTMMTEAVQAQESLEDYIDDAGAPNDAKVASLKDDEAAATFAKPSADGAPALPASGDEAESVAASGKGSKGSKGSKGGGNAGASGGACTGSFAILPPPDLKLKAQAVLWSDIMMLAWANQDVDTVHRAARYLLADCWHPRQYASFLALQVTAQYTLAESFAYLIEQLPDSTIVPHFLGAPKESMGGSTSLVSHGHGHEEVLTEEQQAQRAVLAQRLRQLGVTIPDCPDSVAQLKLVVIGAVSGGIRRALRLATAAADPDATPNDELASAPFYDGEDDTSGLAAVAQLAELAPVKPWNAYIYLVENGATLMWNFHLQAFLNRQWSDVTPELIDGLRLCERALRLVNSSQTDLYASIAEALARSLIAIEPQETPNLQEAETVCRRAMVRCRPMQARPLVQVRASLTAAGRVPAGNVPIKLGDSGGGGAAKGKADKGKGDKKGKGDAKGKGADGGSEEPALGLSRSSFEDCGDTEPAFDENGVVETARGIHFEVLGILEAIAVKGSGTAPAAADLAKAVELMRADQANTAAAAEAAAKVAAYRIFKCAQAAGGGPLGLAHAAEQLPSLVVSSRSVSSREADEEALAMRAELWAKLSAEALAQNQPRMAQACAKASCDIVPSAEQGGAEVRARVPTTVWRWWSVAERFWARAVAAMINEEDQEKQTRDELRCAALEHLLASASAALHGGKDAPPLVMHAARELWNVAVPMMGSVTRYSHTPTRCPNAPPLDALPPNAPHHHHDITPPHHDTTNETAGRCSTLSSRGSWTRWLQS